MNILNILPEVKQVRIQNSLVEGCSGRATECGSIASATPNRKRGRSMSRRSGQAGRVVRKGNRWHGRYYVDVPGQEERKRVSHTGGSDAHNDRQEGLNSESRFCFHHSAS